jgi:hypothetical protein
MIASEEFYLRKVLREPKKQECRLEYYHFLQKEYERISTIVGLSEVFLRENIQKRKFLIAQLENDIDYMRKLAVELHPNWLAVVSNVEILNCGCNPQRDEQRRRWWETHKDNNPESSYEEWNENHPSFEFEFVCTKKWDEMKATENKKVRFCEGCSKNVYFCDNIMEARELGRQGCCIGIDVGVERRDTDLVEIAMFGRPSQESLDREAKKRLPDPVSAHRLLKKFDANMRGKTTSDDYKKA